MSIHWHSCSASSPSPGAEAWAQKLFLSFSQDIPNQKFWGHGLEIFALINLWVFLMRANICETLDKDIGIINQIGKVWIKDLVGSSEFRDLQG